MSLISTKNSGKEKVDDANLLQNAQEFATKQQSELIEIPKDFNENNKNETITNETVTNENNENNTTNNENTTTDSNNNNSPIPKEKIPQHLLTQHSDLRIVKPRTGPYIPPDEVIVTKKHKYEEDYHQLVCFARLICICCPICGLISLYYAIQARDAKYRVKRENLAQKAKISMVVQVICTVIFIIILLMAKQ